MALMVSDFVSVRNALERSGAVVWTKLQINAALQAIDDVMSSTPIPVGAVGATIPQYVGNRIDAATSPLVLDAAQKRRLFAFWASLKFEKDR